MVKVKETVETEKCDKCGKDAGYKCDCCGADFCYDCGYAGKGIIRYVHAVHFSGSEDLRLCVKCDTSPPPELIPTLEAYKAIASLKVEEEKWYEGFRIRAKQAEVIAQQRLEAFKKKA